VRLVIAWQKKVLCYAAEAHRSQKIRGLLSTFDRMLHGACTRLE
jgi:hypothetical protein